MPRNPNAPRASEVHWLSEDEKRFALNSLPEGESFSNYARKALFNLPPLEKGGSRKEKTLNIKSEIANLQSQIVVNLAYAKAAEATYEKTGRQSAANSAAQSRAAIARKEAHIEKLKAQLESEA